MKAIKQKYIMNKNVLSSYKTHFQEAQQYINSYMYMITSYMIQYSLVQNTVMALEKKYRILIIIGRILSIHAKYHLYQAQKYTTFASHLMMFMFMVSNAIINVILYPVFQKNTEYRTTFS